MNKILSEARYIQVSAEHKDFLELVGLLDAELLVRDGDDHAFYAQFNKSDTLSHVLILYLADIPIACGGFRLYLKDTIEIKRMYVRPAYRGQGLAYALLTQIEKLAHDNGYAWAILETGFNQPEAIALYKKAGYGIINNYGPYQGVEGSICFKKEIKGL